MIADTYWLKVVIKAHLKPKPLISYSNWLRCKQQGLFSSWCPAWIELNLHARFVQPHVTKQISCLLKTIFFFSLMAELGGFPLEEMGIWGHTRSSIYGLWSPFLGKACALVHQVSLHARALVVPEEFLQHLKARRSWVGGHLGFHQAAVWAVGEAQIEVSNPRNKWCDLGHDFVPSWASVSSSCKMNLSQIPLSFRPQTLVYP